MDELSTTLLRRRILSECSGACGDLGTFIPHAIGAITVAGLAPAGVLLGFSAFLIATGLFYGLPLPVQPMKAISAVILTGGLGPGEVTAAGIIIGVVLLLLGVTDWIGRLASAIPQSVSAGLQLGLGLLMGSAGPPIRRPRRTIITIMARAGRFLRLVLIGISRKLARAKRPLRSPRAGAGRDLPLSWCSDAFS